MAADVKLLPLPELPRQVEGYNSDYWEAGQIEEYAADYARANVAHATAALQAENERLRAEVERLTFEMSCLQQQYDERTAYVIVHRGAALACSDAVRAAYSDEHHRAERLAKALALLPDEIVMIEHNPYEGPLMFCCGRRVTLSWRHGIIPTHDEECWYARMRALRDHDQEEGQ